MFENMNKTNVYAYLAGIFCACMIASNILATRTLEISFIVLPCSILTFPMLFVVNDILSEIYGFKLTKNIIYLGFIINVVVVALYQVAMIFPSSSPNAPAFAALLSTTPRLFVAGLISYMLGNLLNSGTCQIKGKILWPAFCTCYSEYHNGGNCRFCNFYFNFILWNSAKWFDFDHDLLSDSVQGTVRTDILSINQKSGFQNKNFGWGVTV